jgi:hypothetical protein
MQAVLLHQAERKAETALASKERHTGLKTASRVKRFLTVGLQLHIGKASPVGLPCCHAYASTGS